MNQEEIDFANFIKELMSQADIPLQERRNFMAHLTQTGYMDEKCQKFAAQYWSKRQQQSTRAEAHIAHVAQTLDNLSALEEDPETSLSARITKEGAELMTSMSDRFVSNFKAREKMLVTNAETNEHEAELDQVAALKAAL